MKTQAIDLYLSAASRATSIIVNRLADRFKVAPNQMRFCPVRVAAQEVGPNGPLQLTCGARDRDLRVSGWAFMRW